MISLKIDRTRLTSRVDSFVDTIKKRYFRSALAAGAKICELAYREVLRSHANKRGPQAGNSLVAFTAVGTKIGTFKSGNGMYALIGIKKEGGQRTAPQVLWGEEGTKDRKHKSGHPTGREPKQGWMMTAESLSLAQARAEVIRKLESYAGKH